MKETEISASVRNVVGKQVKALRRSGGLPAVIYGQGIEPILITLDLHSTSRILSSISSTQLVDIKINGKSHTTLVREKQRHPVTGSIIHVDFQEVSLTEKIRVEVRIELTGDSPAVKYYNGILVSGLEEIEIEALPRDLPERIWVDVSGLAEIGDSIHVRDLSLPTKVAILDSLDEMVVVVTAPEAEEEIETG